MMVKIAFDGDSMKILQSSTTFACTFGPCVRGKNLMDWVSSDQRKPFKRWMERSANWVYWASREVFKRSPDTRFCSLKLQSAHIECEVDCEVEDALSSPGDWRGQVFLVRLCLTNLKETHGQMARTSGRYWSHERAKASPSNSRSADQRANSQQSGAQLSDFCGSNSSLEAIIDVKASPMQILSCSVGLMAGTETTRIEDIVPSEYMYGFTEWLNKQVAHVALHSSSEQHETFELKFASNQSFRCNIEPMFSHWYDRQDPDELPVLVTFHPLHGSRKESALPSFRMPSFCSSSCSASLPPQEIHGHLHL